MTWPVERLVQRSWHCQLSGRYRENDMASWAAGTERMMWQLSGQWGWHDQLSGRYREDDMASWVAGTERTTWPVEWLVHRGGYGSWVSGTVRMTSGLRKVTSIARSRLEIWEPLQSKIYVSLRGAKRLQTFGVCFRIKVLEPGARKTLRCQKVCSEAKTRPQEPRCGCKSQAVAAGTKIWLREPRCCCRSQDVAAGAKMWLQESGYGSQSANLATGAMYLYYCAEMKSLKNIWNCITFYCFLYLR